MFKSLINMKHIKFAKEHTLYLCVWRSGSYHHAFLENHHQSICELIIVMVLPWVTNQENWKFSLTMVGIEPTTYGLLVQCSSKWVKTVRRFDISELNLPPSISVCLKVIMNTRMTLVNYSCDAKCNSVTSWASWKI